MEKSRFFNSVSGDRKYLAEDFAGYFSNILSNGVFLHEATALQVTPSSGLTVSIAAGKAYINGYCYENTTALAKTFETVIANRIDRIVVRLDMINRTITVNIKKGTAATTPSAPALVRTSDTWELGIADIYLASGTTTVTSAMITDLRANSTYCGGVTMTVDRDEVLGNLNNTYTEFTEAATRANIATNETTPTILGKIKKFFTDLKALAFKATAGTADIDNAAITTAKIADSAVTTSKLGSGAVTTVKVADANITSGKLGSGAVTTEKLGSGAVTDAKVSATAGIQQSKIAGLVDALAAKLNTADLTTQISDAFTEYKNVKRQYIDYTTLNKPFSSDGRGTTRIPLTLLAGKSPSDILAYSGRITIDDDIYYFSCIPNVYNNCITGFIGQHYSSVYNSIKYIVGEIGIDNSSQFYCTGLAKYTLGEASPTKITSGAKLYYLSIIYK